MSACSTPVLKSRSEILDELRDIITDDKSTDKQLTTALNLALGTWSSRVKTCCCIDLPCPLVCGQCEYDLPCCEGIDDARVFVAPYCGGGDMECFVELRCFDIRCGKLITDGHVEGRVRLMAYTDNAPQQFPDLLLAKDFLIDDTEIWIQGRVENLPPFGWLKVCDEWIKYQCWEQAEYPYPDEFDVTLQDAWIDGDIDPEIGTEQPGIDPEDGLAVADVTCGVNTVLYAVERRCNNSPIDAYPQGVEVEIGMAAPNHQAFAILLNDAIANAYRLRMSTCTSPRDREFFASLWVEYKAVAQESWQGFRNPRKPILKLKPDVYYHGAYSHQVKQLPAYAGRRHTRRYGGWF